MDDVDLLQHATRLHNEWQHTAYLTLGRLLSRAHRDGLPPLEWTVLPHGALRGEVPHRDSRGEEYTPATGLALYERWCAYLGPVKHEKDRVYSLLGKTIKTARASGAQPWMKDTHIVLRVELREE